MPFPTILRLQHTEIQGALRCERPRRRNRYGHATEFDARSGNVLATINVDDCTEFLAADGKGAIYDSLLDKSTVIAIDARTMRVVATYRLALYTGPTGMAMDTQTRRPGGVRKYRAGPLLQAIARGPHNYPNPSHSRTAAGPIASHTPRTVHKVHVDGGLIASVCP